MAGGTHRRPVHPGTVQHNRSADERAGELIAPESDSEREVEYIEPDSTHLQTETMAQQLLCPLVVAQTRHMEGCNPVLFGDCVGVVMS